MTSVAVLGTGLLGTAIATRLLEQGLNVHVWNRDPSRIVSLVEKGATAIAVPRRPVPRTATEVMGSGDQILFNLNVVEQTLPSTALFSGFQAICGFAG